MQFYIGGGIPSSVTVLVLVKYAVNQVKYTVYLLFFIVARPHTNQVDRILNQRHCFYILT